MFQTDPFSLILLLVGLSLVPFVAMIATSYLKIVIVMSLIRNALGIQSIPPNMVINAMALILTFYIMAPLLGESWNTLQQGLKDNKPEVIYQTDLVFRAAEPFRGFLVRHTSDQHQAFFVRTAENLWGKEVEQPDGTFKREPAKVDPQRYYILIPSFCVSELTRAFQIGFLVYLPFIAIDIIVSNILLAMGMMMVSPVTISLPFKLLLFVMVNGWTLLIQGLVRGYLL
jgi:type III secretion protein R